jgi:hypothetical protein
MLGKIRFAIRLFLERKLLTHRRLAWFRSTARGARSRSRGLRTCSLRHSSSLRMLLLLLLLEYVYPTEQVQLRDRRIAREKKYIQITLPKDVKRMLMYVIIFAHGI